MTFARFAALPGALFILAGCAKDDASAASAETLASAAPIAAASPAPAATPVYPAADVPAGTEITVYKTPTCGCCSAWVDHLKANGFVVNAKDIPDLTALKSHYGVTRDLASCHTAFVDGYVIEGHVPADLIARLLKEKPAVKGLAVPGMPMGSPGMEGDYVDRYDVVAFDSTGRKSVYASRP